MARRKIPRRRRAPDRIAPVSKPLRTEQSRGGRAETYRALPIEPGDTQVGWVRRRARVAGSSVNARDDLAWKDYPWLEEGDQGIACSICGTEMAEQSFGVTWGEGEERVRAANRAGGGYRTRGPLLWAMRVIKFERFGEAHMICEAFYPDPLTRPPPDIAWLCIWGSACDLAQALYADPSLISQYWSEWDLRSDVWKAPVRRKLLRAYQKRGDAGVRALMDEGVAFKGRNIDGDRVSMEWDLVPF